MVFTVKKIKKSYGKKVALNNVTFSLMEGIYGLLGPNGAGKSTLINILIGNLKADFGEILWNGENIFKNKNTYLKKIGYVPQTQALYPEFTAKDYLAYMAALKGLSKKEANEAIAYVLKAVELNEKAGKKIKTFSGGMKQRLLIAQALLGEPQLLIMDEPTAGLDPRQRIIIRNLIANLAKKRIVIIATHIVSDIEFIAKEILLLKEGNLLKKETVQNLFIEVKSQISIDSDEKEYSSDLEKIYWYYFEDKNQ